MASDQFAASTPRVARMPRELLRSPAGIGDADASRRMERSQHRRTARRAGRRLLIGCLVIAGVALAVATDFVQFRAVAGPAGTDHVAVRVVPADHGDTVR